MLTMAAGLFLDWRNDANYRPIDTKHLSSVNYKHFNFCHVCKQWGFFTFKIQTFHWKSLIREPIFEFWSLTSGPSEKLWDEPHGLDVNFKLIVTKLMLTLHLSWYVDHDVLDPTSILIVHYA